jgi:hypothetical protein
MAKGKKTPAYESGSADKKADKGMKEGGPSDKKADAAAMKPAKKGKGK